MELSVLFYTLAPISKIFLRFFTRGILWGPITPSINKEALQDGLIVLTVSRIARKIEPKKNTEKKGERLALFMESWNHRMSWVVKDLKDYLILQPHFCEQNC